jgi:hypothetical protein
MGNILTSQERIAADFRAAAGINTSQLESVGDAEPTANIENTLEE